MFQIFCFIKIILSIKFIINRFVSHTISFWLFCFSVRFVWFYLWSQNKFCARPQKLFFLWFISASILYYLLFFCRIIICASDHLDVQLHTRSRFFSSVGLSRRDVFNVVCIVEKNAHHCVNNIFFFGWLS